MEVKISQEVLSGLQTKKSLIGENVKMLTGNFTLRGTQTPEGMSADLTIKGESNRRVKLIYESEAGVPYTVTVMGFLGFAHSTAKTPTKASTSTVSKVMSDALAQTGSTSFPSSFTVCKVSDRVKNGKKVYSVFDYQEFLDKMDTLGEGEELDTIFNDRKFIGSLADEKPIEGAEPLKDLIVKF